MTDLANRAYNHTFPDTNKRGNYKKYHFIYKTTNLVNGRYYIGQHSTNKIDDNYLGSGRWLMRAINKYGRKNFSREIICFASSHSDLNRIERILVNEKTIKDPKSYNIAIGGDGGFSHSLKSRNLIRITSKKMWNNMNDNEKIIHCKKIKIGLDNRSEFLKNKTLKAAATALSKKWETDQSYREKMSSESSARMKRRYESLSVDEKSKIATRASHAARKKKDEYIDSKSFIFKHEDGEVFQGNRTDFIKKVNLPVEFHNKFFYKGRNRTKTILGWLHPEELTND